MAPMKHLARLLIARALALASLCALFAIALFAGAAFAQGTGTPAPGLDLIALFLKIAPLLAALGLFHVGAAALRLAWNKVVVAAGGTPNKVDDFVVHLMDPAVQSAITLIDAGDVDAAKNKLIGLRALVK